MTEIDPQQMGDKSIEAGAVEVVPVLARPEVKKARARLEDALHEYGGTLKLGFISIQGQNGPIPIPEAEGWTQTFATHHAILMDLKREITVIGSCMKVMALMIPDESLDEVTRLTAESINQHAANIENAAADKKKAKTSIITAEGMSGLPKDLRSREA